MDMEEKGKKHTYYLYLYSYSTIYNFMLNLVYKCSMLNIKCLKFSRDYLALLKLRLKNPFTVFLFFFITKSNNLKLLRK